MNNLVALTSNKPGFQPVLVNGRPVKSINQFYNKRGAHLQSQLRCKGTTRRLERLTHTRNRRINHYIHTTSRRIIDLLVKEGIGVLCIGKNDAWKQEANLGKRNNQHFVQVPHARFIAMFTYKAELVGIRVVITEESYTSLEIELDNGPLSRHNARMSYSLHASHSLPAPGQVHFIQSYAKINLTLDVLGRRSDGYHDLITIMQTVDLADTLALTMLDEDAVHITCSHPDLSIATNLAVRAAQAIRTHFGISQGLSIELQKRVPVAAGLGGGSSNAAAVLLALQRWWKLPLSAETLLHMAAALGSDVPFFLRGGLALCEGRGERITQLPARLPSSFRWLLLVKPSIGVSTALVFRNLSPQDYSDGASSHMLLTTLQKRAQFHAEELHNSLERGVLQHYPPVAQARQALLQAGAPEVRLSGSGPTLFAPFPTLSQAQAVLHQLQPQGYEVYLTHAIFPTGEQLEYF